MGNRMWMVRAGEGAYLFEQFRDNNLIAIGWETGDLASLKEYSDIKAAMRKTYPDDKEGRINFNTCITY